MKLLLCIYDFIKNQKITKHNIMKLDEFIIFLYAKLQPTRKNYNPINDCDFYWGTLSWKKILLLFYQ
jgi:hypothetical protein